PSCMPPARDHPDARPPRSPPGRDRASPRAPPRRARPAPRPRLCADRSAELASELLEEALVVPVGGLVALPLELLEQLTLLRGQAARNGHVHEHAVVTVSEALEHRHPLPAEDANLTGLRSGRQLE